MESMDWNSKRVITGEEWTQKMSDADRREWFEENQPEFVDPDTLEFKLLDSVMHQGHATLETRDTQGEDVNGEHTSEHRWHIVIEDQPPADVTED